jgi:hypothetical protein
MVQYVVKWLSWTFANFGLMMGEGFYPLKSEHGTVGN